MRLMLTYAVGSIAPYPPVIFRKIGLVSGNFANAIQGIWQYKRG
jgi:hypothetical protein